MFLKEAEPSLDILPEKLVGKGHLLRKGDSHSFGGGEYSYSIVEADELYIPSRTQT